jgi:hypothetical protein
MRTPVGPSRTSGSLNRTASTSDILMVTRRHVRPASVLTDSLSADAPVSLPRGDTTGIHLRAEGPRVAKPVRAGRARARERLPSYRECASRNPQTEPAPTVLERARFRAPFRLLSTRAPRQALLRASSGLAPCRSVGPCGPPEDKTRDASDRLLPPERFTCTRTSWVPGSLRDFHRVDPHGVLGSVRLPGDRVFHDTRERFGGSPLDTRCHIASSPSAPFSVRELGAWASSSHGASIPIEPLTPLSPLPLLTQPVETGWVPRNSRRSAFATPFDAWALASRIALPREEAAKITLTIFS